MAGVGVTDDPDGAVVILNHQVARSRSASEELDVFRAVKCIDGDTVGTHDETSPGRDAGF